MAPHFMLEALGVAYELITVDRKSNAQKSSEYLALNPAGRIPTLVDVNLNDFVIFESPAICIHLAESHPESNLIPPLGDINRPLFYQWMMYLTNTIQAELMIYFYPQKHTTNSDVLEDIVKTQEARITEMFELLDKELKGKSYLVGDTVTACDYFLFMLAVWADEFKTPPLAFKSLGGYLRNLAAHDAVIKVCEKEGLSLADYK